MQSSHGVFQHHRFGINNCALFALSIFQYGVASSTDCSEAVCSSSDLQALSSMSITPVIYASRKKSRIDYVGSIPEFGLSAVGVQAMRRGGDPVPVEPAEFSTKRRRTGRYKKRSLRNLYRQVNRAQSKIILRFNGLNAFSTVDAGYYKLFNHYNSVNPASLLRSYPLYFFDITSFARNNAGNSSVASPGFTIGSQEVAASRRVDLANVFGTAANGTTISTEWQVEHTPTTQNDVDMYKGYESVLKWVSIRLLCYGTTTMPTKWSVSLVQFPDTEYDFFFQNEVSAPPASYSQSGVALLDYLMAGYDFNPIQTSDSMFRSKIRFLMNQNFILNTPAINEGTTIPHMKEIDIFRKFDRNQRYDWRLRDLTTFNQEQTAAFAPQINEVQNQVHPRARIYLMIRAQSRYSTAAGPPVFNIQNNPSFDMQIRVQHEVQM